jgi:hypothetical protein
MMQTGTETSLGVMSHSLPLEHLSFYQVFPVNEHLTPARTKRTPGGANPARWDWPPLIFPKTGQEE